MMTVRAVVPGHNRFLQRLRGALQGGRMCHSCVPSSGPAVSFPLGDKRNVDEAKIRREQPCPVVRERKSASEQRKMERYRCDDRLTE
jgi:hypothetical protein